jgi:cytochrome c-type biogenesis protein CcmH
MAGMVRTVAALVLMLVAIGIHAADADDTAPRPSDPALEAQVQRVASELRCLVCQNQTIADSNAELARDLRREVRAMLARGQSEEQVREFMVARYGDFILYRPPFKATTLLLWAGPFVLLGAGIWGLGRIARGRRRVVGAAALSPEEEARLDAIVNGRENGLR